MGMRVGFSVALQQSRVLSLREAIHTHMLSHAANNVDIACRTRRVKCDV